MQDKPPGIFLYKSRRVYLDNSQKTGYNSNRNYYRGCWDNEYKKGIYVC